MVEPRSTILIMLHVLKLLQNDINDSPEDLLIIILVCKKDRNICLFWETPTVWQNCVVQLSNSLRVQHLKT